MFHLVCLGLPLEIIPDATPTTQVRIFSMFLLMQQDMKQVLGLTLYVTLLNAVSLSQKLYNMYTIRNYVYADAGRILIGKNKIGYKFKGELDDFTESEINIDDMTLESGMFIYNSGRIREISRINLGYAELKAHLVKKMFTNDDQIAIMLNRYDSESDGILYDKMQKYRTWCSRLAKKMMEVASQ